MSPLNAALRRLEAQGSPASHLSRLQRLVELAQRQESHIAIALVGSYAKGKGDPVSDLDLVVIAPDQAVEQVLGQAYDVLRQDESLNSFTGRHKSGGAFWKVVYLDFSSAELHVFPRSTLFKLRNPFLPIWDPESILSLYVTPGEPVRHEDFPAYEYGDEGLVWELVDCIKWLSRGNNKLAKGYLVKLAVELQKSKPQAADPGAA